MALDTSVIVPEHNNVASRKPRDVILLVIVTGAGVE